MNTTPEFWKTRLDHVEQTLSIVKKGKVSTPYKSAGGRPLYLVEYGKSNIKLGTSNCAAALSMKDIKRFADKTSPDYVPTVFFVGCIHGAEFEGVAALLNLIKLIETGTDYKGECDQELLDLANIVHLVIVPMINPDGRARVPFDSMVGKTYYELRYYNQGTWKNGELCNYPTHALHHPVKEYAGYLGGYFNDDGYNMMSEDFFSPNVSTGTRLAFDVCREHVPDFTILFHGGDNSRPLMIFTPYVSGATATQMENVMSAFYKRCDEEGSPYWEYPFRNRELDEVPPGFGLTSAMHHICSEPVITFESNQGLVDRGTLSLNHDEIYKSHKIIIKETIKEQLKRYGKL